MKYIFLAGIKKAAPEHFCSGTALIFQLPLLIFYFAGNHFHYLFPATP